MKIHYIFTDDLCNVTKMIIMQITFQMLPLFYIAIVPWFQTE